VHQQTVVACALLRTGRGTQRAVQTFGTTTADLLALQAWRTEQPVTHVAMESTASDWKPVFNLLESRFTPWLVNPAHIKAVPGRKTDVQDAEWIADRLQHGLLKPSFIPDRGPRELRELTRYRKSLIEERAREVNRIQKVLEGANIQLSSRVSDILGKSGPRMLAALAAGTTDPAALAALADDRLRATPAERQRALQGLMGAHQQCLLRQPLQHLAALDRPVAELDADVETRLAPFEAARALWESLPGVGRRTAETILAEIGPPVAPFRSPGALAQWGGLAPGNHASAGKRLAGRTLPGNRSLRAALVEAAPAAGRTQATSLGAQYRRAARTKGAQRAAVIVAPRLVVDLWSILPRQQPYADLGVEDFDRRDEEQVRRPAVKRLEGLGYHVTLTAASSAGLPAPAPPLRPGLLSVPPRPRLTSAFFGTGTCIRPRPRT
jgi:transposase